MRRSAVCMTVALATMCGCTGGPSTESEEGAPRDNAAGAELRGEEQVAAGNLRRAYLEARFLTVDTDREAECLATGLVDRLGLPSMKRYGMLGEDLAASLEYGGALALDDAETHVDVLLTCVEHSALVQDMVAPEELAMPDDYVRRCVNAVTEREVRDAFALLLSGGDYHESAYATKLAAAGCSYEGD